MNLAPVSENPSSLYLPEEISAGSHAAHSERALSWRFWVSLGLTVAVFFFSSKIQRIFGFELTFPGHRYVPLVLSAAIFAYGGWLFLAGAVRELRRRQPGMMTLVAIAITSAFGYSVFSLFYLRGDTLFETLATLVTVMLLGHWLELRAVREAHRELGELAKLLPDLAEVIRGDRTESVALSDLRVGDVVLVRPGGRIPADGEVVAGQSEVTESLLTGESKPVAKSVGSQVTAGTINGDGVLRVKVTRIGRDTFLAGVMRLVAEAQLSKSKLQLISDRAAFYLTLIAVSVGAITFSYWWIVGTGPAFALERLVAVLVVACPHALGLAVPLAASFSSRVAAKNGLLIRDKAALEAAADVKIALFDKTGTLTHGEYGIDRIWAVALPDEDAVLRYAAAVDANSEHVIAKAVVRRAREKGIIVPEVSNFTAVPGHGVSGVVEGKIVKLGGPLLFTEASEGLPSAVAEDVRKENAKGKTVVVLLYDSRIGGLIALADLIRNESRAAVQGLRKMGIDSAMVTGDSEDVAAWVAGEVGISERFARVEPQDKAEKVSQLQQRGLKVMMVGDGINDAPALMRADVGVAIGAGTNVAIESAGIILVKNDPRDVIKIVRLSKATRRLIVQNLFWATAYNVVALPLAAGVFAARGVLLEPYLSAIFMTLSTIIVSVNALGLLRIKLVDESK